MEQDCIVEELEHPIAKVENLPFFNTMYTLLSPIICLRSDNEDYDITGTFYLPPSIRKSIVESWSVTKKEYKVQVILRLVQVERQENIPDHLPNNISISVNDQHIKLPEINNPIRRGLSEWRCNVPIDITEKTELKSFSQNTLRMTWSEETDQYIAGVYVSQKLTWDELLVDLEKKPLLPSVKTKELIKKCMVNDGDIMCVDDSIFVTIKDPLSKTKMKLPARGHNCVHVQCFDAIQFLQMNEQKQTWICPICKEKLSYENIEIDEFFLNIIKSPNLSEDCENVFLLHDGSWTENKNIVSTNVFKTNCNNSEYKIEVIELSDSSDDENLIPPLL